MRTMGGYFYLGYRKMKFSKQPLSFSDQLTLLESRGLIISNRDYAEHYLKHLSTVRNVCAHHSRLWNREFTFTFKLPKKHPPELLSNLNFSPIAKKKLYNSLVMLEYLMEIISPGTHWKNRLTDLIDKHGIDTGKMGFPSDWHELEIWKTR